MNNIYLDNAATTPLCDAAKSAMTAAMECFGNPSSVHETGAEAAKLLREAAAKAARTPVAPFKVEAPYEIKIVYSECPYLHTMKRLHPEIFENENTVVMRGDNLLKTWSQYLVYEKEMVNFA